MNIFFSIFIKISSYVFSITFFILIILGISSYLETKSANYFEFTKGDKNSENTIIILKLKGPIINAGNNIADFIEYRFITPDNVASKLNIIEDINPKILIISLNSPGGTVNATNEVYEKIIQFKKITKIPIYFHTNEILASGAYWISMAGEKIFASYGSLIGSIGVKGPDWFFYDEPTAISSGIFGQSIETKKGIKVFSQNVGQSKDLLNPFRKPTKIELNHLNSLIKVIYDDFINLVSKNRKLETNVLKNEIGGLIYNSIQAKNNFLIDDEITLDNLLNKILKDNKYNNFKILESIENNNNLLERVLISLINNNEVTNQVNFTSICHKLRNNIVAISSYQTVGC